MCGGPLGSGTQCSDEGPEHQTAVPAEEVECTRHKAALGVGDRTTVRIPRNWRIAPRAECSVLVVVMGNTPVGVRVAVADTGQHWGPAAAAATAEGQRSSTDAAPRRPCTQQPCLE